MLGHIGSLLGPVRSQDSCGEFQKHRIELLCGLNLPEDCPGVPVEVSQDVVQKFRDSDCQKGSTGFQVLHAFIRVPRSMSETHCKLRALRF